MKKFSKIKKYSNKFVAFLLIVCLFISVVPAFSMQISVSNKSETQKLIDALIAEGENFDSTINLSKYNISAEAAQNLSAVLWLEPLLFVYNANSQYSYMKDSNNILYSITGLDKRFSNKSELDAAKKFFNDECKKIADMVDSSFTDLEKVLFVNNYICSNFEYDFSYTNYDAYSMLRDKKGVCQAYTLLARQIFRLLGIESDSVFSSTANHVWLKVKVDGKWYHLDITHNDPTGSKPGFVSYKYFLVSSDKVSDNYHGTDFTAVLNDDDCSDTSYDEYFWRNISSPIVYVNGSWYYMASADSSIPNDYSNNIMKTDNFTDFSVFYEKKDLWFANAEKTNCWVGAQSGLGSVGRFLIYNTMYDLVALDTESGKTSVLYSLSSSGTDGIFGCQVTSDKINMFVQNCSTNPSSGIYTVVSIDIPKWLTEEATPTPTATTTPTATPTIKPTATPTVKPTATPTVKPTATPTVKPTATPTVKPTATATPTIKPTNTPTPTVKPTETPTPTATSTVKSTETPTQTPTAKPTVTPTETATATSTQEPSPTPTEKASDEPTPTATQEPDDTDYGNAAELGENMVIEQNLITVPQGTKCGLLLKLLDGTIRDIYGNVPQKSSVLGTGFMIQTEDGFFTIAIKGDLDGDGEITILDAIYLSDYCSDSEAYPICYDCDFNNDGNVDKNDAIELLKSIIDVKLYGKCY